jgi:hypothetical protein
MPSYGRHGGRSNPVPRHRRRSLADAGTVKVWDTAGDSCTVTLAQAGSSAVGVGSCNLTGLALWGWHRFHSVIVKVTGSAASNQGWYGSGGPGSHSTAFVKIVPRGWWWAF